MLKDKKDKSKIPAEGFGVASGEARAKTLNTQTPTISREEELNKKRSGKRSSFFF